MSSASTAASKPEKPSAEITFRDGIEEDDELWTEYLQLAKEFDTRLVDEWTKIVDTILVYVCSFSYRQVSLGRLKWLIVY